MTLRLNLVVSCLLLSWGCATPDDQAQLIEQEIALGRLERRLDDLAALGERVQLLEKSLAAPPKEAGPDDLSARLEALEVALSALEGKVGVLRTPPPPESPGSLLLPPARGVQPEPLATFEAPPSKASRPLPPPDMELQALTLGSGSELLVRSEGGLEQLRLIGLETPLQGAVYARVPKVLLRHQAAFGRSLGEDQAWRASREHLEALLAGATLSLSFAERRGDVIYAFVQVRSPAGVALDLNAAMIRDGFALATGGHRRASAYRMLEREARAAERGLFSSEAQEGPR